jgi:hypothetical protein
MTLDEEDSFIQRIMANHDTAMAATAASTTQTVMILTPNRLWNISKVCVMQGKLWKSLP